MTFRVTAVDFDVASQSWRPPDGTAALADGEQTVVGREGDLPSAVSPLDAGVSRRALTVAVIADAWNLQISNANHVWLHPWGQRPSWLEAGSTVHKRWPRLAVLLVGGREDVHHWVFLESDNFPSDWLARRSGAADSAGTRVRGTAGGLTALQLEAVQTVFATHLAWPPVVSAEPMLLQAAARKLRIVPNAVTERLKQAQSRAYALGPHRQTGVMNPEYIYLLASAGYLPVPTPFVPAR